MDRNINPITNKYETENLIKFNSLAPSLQKRFYDLENYSSTTYRRFGETHNDIRITMDYYPPPLPKECKEFWIDKNYRSLRVFAEGNWEFTRAAWTEQEYGKPGIPKRQDINPTESIIGAAKNRPRKFSIMEYKSGTTAPIYKREGGTIVTDPDNYQQVIFTQPNLTIKIDGRWNTPNPDDIIGYLLILIYAQYKESAESYAIPLKASNIGPNGEYPHSVAVKQNYQILTDIDLAIHTFDAVVPTDFVIPNSNYAGTYFTEPFPYKTTRAMQDDYRVNNIPFSKDRPLYVPYTGDFVIKIILEDISLF